MEELETVKFPDDMLEAINTATNGDMQKINIMRQFLDLEDEPASYFKEMTKLTVKLIFDWQVVSDSTYVYI